MPAHASSVLPSASPAARYRHLGQRSGHCARGLDSWPGIGHVAVGMHRQGFDLQLTQYDDRGWRATFYTTGMEHSPSSATGTAWERTLWRATQRAAWEALAQAREAQNG